MIKSISKTLTYLGVAVIGGVLVGLAILYSPAVFAAVNPVTNNLAAGQFRSQPLLVATTTTATSTNNAVQDQQLLRIAGAKKVTVYFSRGWGGGNSGSSIFSVQVSPNGDDWYYFNKLQENATSTKAATSASFTNNVVTITAATSTVVRSLDLTTDSFYAIRCVVVETTDGSHSCTVTAEF
jgi:poly(3-hydroxybutyrate) depolymerase